MFKELGGRLDEQSEKLGGFNKVKGFPVTQLVKSLPAIQETGFYPWVRKIPLRRKWQLIPVFLPGESHGQRNLGGYSPWGS